MTHRGVEYMLVLSSTPGIWKWRFQIGEKIKTGWVETRIDLLAVRRVKQRIDRELKAVAS